MGMLIHEKGSGYGKGLQKSGKKLEFMNFTFHNTHSKYPAMKQLSR